MYYNDKTKSIFAVKVRELTGNAHFNTFTDVEVSHTYYHEMFTVCCNNDSNCNITHRLQRCWPTMILRIVTHTYIYIYLTNIFKGVPPIDLHIACAFDSSTLRSKLKMFILLGTRESVPWTVNSLYSYGSRINIIVLHKLWKHLGSKIKLKKKLRFKHIST